MSDAAAFSALDRFVDFLKTVPNLGKEAAPKVAEELAKQLAADIAKGVNPYGETLVPKKDGGQPLKNAAKAITVKAMGSKVEISLEGIEVMHHLGNARGYRGGSKRLGGFRRTLIPLLKRGIPGFFKGRIRVVLSERFQHLRHTEARRRA